MKNLEKIVKMISFSLISFLIGYFGTILVVQVLYR